MSNEIVPGPERPISARLNGWAILALSLVLFSVGLFLWGFVHTFLALPEHLQDKLLDMLPTIWPLAIPLITAGMGTVWSFVIGPVLHAKQPS